MGSLEYELRRQIEINQEMMRRIRDLEGIELSSGAFPSGVGAKVYNSEDIWLPHNTLTLLTFDSERWDTNSIHSTVINTGKLTCQTKGIYHIGFALEFSNPPGMAALTGQLNAGVTLNGAIQLVWEYVWIPVDPAVWYTSYLFGRCTVRHLVVGDYLEVYASQASGYTAPIRADPEFSPEFWMQRIG